LAKLSRLPAVLGDIRLALPLAVRASRLARTTAIDRALAALIRSHHPQSGHHPPLMCASATHRAGRLVAAFGGLNTCLTRSLVLAALLSDREGVRLHVGFRTASDHASIPDGHAWVTLDGANVSDLSPNSGGQAFIEATVFQVSRHPAQRTVPT
jgi:hypothetical protein